MSSSSHPDACFPPHGPTREPAGRPLQPCPQVTRGSVGTDRRGTSLEPSLVLVAHRARPGRRPWLRRPCRPPTPGDRIYAWRVEATNAAGLVHTTLAAGRLVDRLPSRRRRSGGSRSGGRRAAAGRQRPGSANAEGNSRRANCPAHSRPGPTHGSNTRSSWQLPRTRCGSTPPGASSALAPRTPSASLSGWRSGLAAAGATRTCGAHGHAPPDPWSPVDRAGRADKRLPDRGDWVRVGRRHCSSTTRSSAPTGMGAWSRNDLTIGTPCLRACTGSRTTTSTSAGDPGFVRGVDHACLLRTQMSAFGLRLALTVHTAAGASTVRLPKKLESR